MEASAGHSSPEPPFQNAPTKFLEETDLVKVLGLGVLATIEHIGGETSSEDETDDEDSDEDDGYPDSHRNFAYHLDAEMQEGTPIFIVNNSANGLRLIDGEFHEGEELADSGNQIDSNNDSDTHDEDDAHSEYHDTDHDPDVPIGSALVTRVDNGEDVVVRVSELEVLDRLFAPGQMVLSAVPGDTNIQTGIVQGIKKTLIVRRMLGWDLSSADAESSVFEIPAERASFFSDVRVDSYVVCRNWLGIVEFIQVDVFVEFPDGSIAVVVGLPGRLISDDPRVSSRANSESEGLFFPGMRVKASSRIWRDASWIRGRFRRQRAGVVRSTKTTNVGVQWIAVRQNLESSSSDPAPHPPPEVVPYSDVRSLDAYQSLWWRAGDRALLDHEQSQEDEKWVEAVPSVPAPTFRDERLASRPRSTRRHPPRGNGRLIAAHRRARELSVQDDTDSSSGSSLASDPAAVVQIIGTRSTVAVLWQNGEVQKDIHSINLRVNEHPGASDFWPGMIVSRTVENSGSIRTKESKDSSPFLGGSLSSRDLQRPGALNIGAFPSPENHLNENTGMVTRVLLEERTAVVRWQKPNSREYFSDEEELSVYDLVACADNDMQLGDTVLLIGKEASESDTASTEPRWIGQIIGKGVGDLEVQWLGGEVSRISPDQVIVVGDEEDDDDTVGSEENEDTELAMDAVDLPGPQNVADPAFRDNWGLDESAPNTLIDAVNYELDIVFGLSSRMSRLVFSKAVDVKESAESLREAIRVSSGMLENGESKSVAMPQIMQFAHAVGVRVLTGCVDKLSETENAEEGAAWPHPTWNELKARVREEVIGVITRKGLAIETSEHNVQSSDNSSLLETTETPIRAEGIPTATHHSDPMDTALGSMQPQQMQTCPISEDVEDELASRFEIVDSLEHHHYASGGSTASAQTRISGFANIVRKEWMRLKKNLPKGIYVHGSEERQDLLRVAIVGPSDTPYENILFYFDIGLPNMYPAEPPRVYFWSHGRRLNPNLYEDGKVCLSILGTWNGDDVEQWDPRNSNVLRVLLSLQAMVFVEQPYYNEAGYQKQRGTVEGKTNSRTYNESTKLLCLKHLVHSVAHGGTPPDFVGLSRKHYCRRQHIIIQRLRNLCESSDNPQAVPGDKISKSGGSSGTNSTDEQYTSRGFRRSLIELVPRVQDVLEKLNAT